jgi:putative SOS response-associated peptidase YedK
VAAIRRLDDSTRRILELRRWGLIPSWAEDARLGQRLINARSETVGEKPAYRQAFLQRRCLIPADGFYEWTSGSGSRQPYHVSLSDRAPFGFAGLWERWRGKSGERVESCTILTTVANERLCAVHDRMPVILHPSNFDLWLDPDVRDAKRLRPLLRPWPSASLALRRVSRRVNDVRHDDPSLLEPVAAQSEPSQLGLDL